MNPRAFRLLPCLSLLYVAGCGSDFDPYNELKSLRLLAVRAEPPALRPGTTTSLDALTYAPDGGTPEIAWSWCPWRAGADAAFECALSEADFKAQLEAAGVPAGAVSYDLGSAASAALAYTLDPLVLGAICSMPLGAESAGATQLLNCDQGFPVSIGVTVTLGDDVVSGFKTIYLALDDSRPLNRNPSVTGLSIAPENAAREEATSLAPGDPTLTATLGKTFELFADVPEESAERFFGTTTAGIEPTDQREVLFITWFIEGGSTAHQRTTFYEGQTDFDVLDRNSWTLPQPEEIDSDRMRLVLVLRDNRGGVSWLTRDVLVQRP